MTRDIDLVVALDESQADTFVQLFEKDYYLEPTEVKNSISRRGMFNLIHNNTIIKVDCIVLKTDPYRQEKFARRIRVRIGDFETWIVSREDLILSKLYWARDSKSEMQLRDVRSLLEADYDLLYVRSRAKTLGIAELLEVALTPDE